MSSTRCFHTINEGPMVDQKKTSKWRYSFQSKMCRNLIGISGVCDLMPFSLSESCYILGRVRFVLGYIVYEDFSMSKSDQRNHTKNPITCLYR